MCLKTIYINDNSFLSMLISSTESFPSKFLGENKIKPKNASPEGEVTGMLFGQRINKFDGEIVFNVTLAVPLHVLVDKSPDSVAASTRHQERVKMLTEAFPNLQYLGEFHSHPYKKEEFSERSAPSLSNADVNTMKINAEWSENTVIEVVFSLTHLSKEILNDGSKLSENLIRGYCGKFKYVIGAYFMENTDSNAEPADRLICPISLGLANYDLD